MIESPDEFEQVLKRFTERVQAKDRVVLFTRGLYLYTECAGNLEVVKRLTAEEVKLMGKLTT